MTAPATASQMRQADDDDEARHHEVEAALQRPLRSRERRRAQFEQRRPFAGDVFGPLQEQLRRAGSDLDLGSEAVSLLDELEQVALGEASVRHDELVNVVFAQELRHSVQATEHGKISGVAVGSNRTEELVANPAPIGAERATQSRQLLALSDQDGSSPRTGQTQHVAREHLVARTKDPDEERRRDNRRRRQAVGREVVAGAKAECERDQGHEHHREHDLTDAGAQLPPTVETAHPEHEHRDDREEGKPLALRLPDDSPQRRPVAKVELAEDERHPDAEHEAGQVDCHEGGDAGEAPYDGKKRRAREEVRPARADVFDRRRPGLGRHGWLRAHPQQCTLALSWAWNS